MYYRQPRYFRDFHCIGGACPDNCCHSWRIDWKSEEVDKLKSAKEKMSPELKALIEKVFVPQDVDEFPFKIEFDKSGRCPYVTEEGLCRIQKELGTEYLSETCMSYPRSYIVASSAVYRFCRLTCGEVMKKLLNSEKSMDLINIEPKEEMIVSRGVDTTLKGKRPELKYFSEVFEFFYEIISDKKRDVENSLVLGALAAQALTKSAECGEVESIPEIIKKLRMQIHDGEHLKGIENIKPNYNVKLGILGQLLKLICEVYHRMNSMVSLTDSDGKFNIDLYNAGEHALQGYLDDKPFAMKNIALNLLFDLTVPFKNNNYTIFENYAIFVTTFALLKLNTIAIAELKNRVAEKQRAAFKMEEFIIRSAAMISRALCQNTKIDELIMEALRGNKMLSPAYLALLVK